MNILIVGPQGDRHARLARLLEGLGYTTTLVDSASGAQAAVAERPIDMALIAMDLPGADSLTLCRKLKPADRPWELPVLMLVEASDPVLVRRCLEAGASDTIRVSAADVEVNARVRAHLRQLGFTRELMAAERQLALGRLLRGLCHEILNPLTILTGYLEMMAGSAEPELRDPAAVALAKAQQIGEVIRHAHKFASADPTRFVPVEVPPLVEEAVALVKLSWTRQPCEITKAVPADLPRVLGDREKLCLALVGLLNNAYSSVGDGGQQAAVTVHAGATGAHVWLTVRDSGRGIPPEDMVHLFDPLRSAEAAGQRSTLGLPAARQIVEEHHGRIEVESYPDQGSLFTIHLPVATV